MRVPPSMIVMGLLTAIPFGLAVKQTMSRTPAEDRELEEDMDPDLAHERQQQERAAAYEKELREEREEAEKLKQQSRKANKKLIDKGAGQLGSAVDAFAFGQPASVAALRQADELAPNVGVVQKTGVHGLIGLQLRIGEECTAFQEDLDQLWGSKPSIDGTKEGPWKTAPDVDVAFDQGACVLSWQQYVPAEQWIGHGDAVNVPIDWVGKSSNIIKTKLGTAVDADDTQAQWLQAGVEGGDATNIVATLEGNRITGITASLNADSKAREAITTRITKLFGAPKEYPESGADLTWGGHPKIELRVTGNFLELTATR